MSELESQVGLTTALTMLAVVETAIVGTLAFLVLRDPSSAMPWLRDQGT